MAKQKFTTGDQVRLLPSRHNPHVRPGVYTIVRVLPMSAMGQQYRAKNAFDSHERVLDEATLSAL